MMNVVGIGSALFDMLMIIDQFPEEDTKLQGLSTKVQCGGPCATALVAISKLGISAEYMGTLGDDMYGTFVKDRLNGYGVDTSHIHILKDRISFHSCVLCNQSNSSRTCVWNKGTVEPPVKEDVDLETLKHAKFLHLDGHQLQTAIFAAEKAHEYGIKVSLDAGGTYPGIEKLLPLIDVLIPSEEFALKLTRTDTAVDAAKILMETYNPETLIITQGVKGGFIWENGREVRYPSFSVKAIDSNGAGDTFHGAFLAATIKEMNTFDAATFASATSAIKCTRFGAQEGIPNFNEVLAFVKAHKEEKEWNV